MPGAGFPARWRGLVFRLGRAGRRSEGQALLLVLILLSMGTLVLAGFLSLTSTLLSARGQDQEDILARYASEAAINDVLADLMQGEDALSPGYAVPGPAINDYAVSVSIAGPAPGTQPAGTYMYFDPGAAYGLSSLTAGDIYYLTLQDVAPSTRLRVNWAFTPVDQRWRVRLYSGEGPPGAPAPAVIAADDWESGGWSGGSGWLGAWSSQSQASVVTASNPYQGSNHVQLVKDASITRSLDLSGRTDVRLRFWSKVYSLESGETATLAVSPDGASWTTVRTWQAWEADNVYRYEDVDLSSFSMTGAFYISFAVHGNNPSDYLWVDDIQVVSQALPAVVAEAGGIKGPGELLVDSAQIAGGEYTLAFENRSGVTHVGASFSDAGGADNTWVYGQVYKDYIISATAGDGTVSAYVRQMPGPATPDMPQKAYIESWREP